MVVAEVGRAGKPACFAWCRRKKGAVFQCAKSGLANRASSFEKIVDDLASLPYNAKHESHLYFFLPNFFA